MTIRQSWLRPAIGGTGLAILLMLRTTSAEAAGPTPAADFAANATTLAFESPVPLETVVACYAATAIQPSFAHQTRAPGAAAVRLRYDGLVFETLDFATTPGGGTAVTIRLSGAYDRRDRKRYASLRGAPLAACLTPASTTASEIAQ